MTRWVKSMAITAGLLACATAVAGCRTVDAIPSAVPASPTPRPVIDTRAELVRYATARRAALIARAAERPSEVARGSVTLSGPLEPWEVDAMLVAAGVDDNYYLAWIEPGTDWSGGVNRNQLQSVVADHPGLQVTYLNAEATVASLLALAEDERVWLVDVDGTENYYALASSTGLLP